jgi:hypothetical protein
LAWKGVFTAEEAAKLEARAHQTRDAERPTREDLDVVERCLTGFNAGPPMLASPYNNVFRLFQTPEYLVIYNEMVHHARIVTLDGRPHGTFRQWVGDSRGRWGDAHRGNEKLHR